MESRDLVSVSRFVSRPVFWSLGLEGLKSCLSLEGFRSQSRALCLETLHRLVFMKFCKKEFLKKRSEKMIVQNLAILRGQWLSCLSLLLCYLRDGENICPRPRSKFILNSIKNVHVVQVVASGRGSGARPPHLKSVSLHFTFEALVAAYTNTAFKKCAPHFRFSATPSGLWSPLLLNPGDGPDVAY